MIRETKRMTKGGHKKKNLLRVNVNVHQTDTTDKKGQNECLPSAQCSVFRHWEDVITDWGKLKMRCQNDQ